MVSGSGPWAWSCDGSNGGASVACTASVSQSGACGNANGGAFTRAPTADLCSHGNASRVTGAGPWNWNCEGNDGGNTESCTALVKDTRYEGIVSNNNPSSDSASASNDSNAPSAAPVAAVTKPAKPVKAAKPVKPTKASLSAPAESAAPATAAVASPAAPEEVTPSYVPPVATTSASTSRDHVTGRLCGSAAELMAIEAPDHNLCQSGSAGPISGDGPFNWTCSDDSGSTSKCSTLAPAGSLNDVIPAITSACLA